MHKRTRANKHRLEKRRRTRRKQRGGAVDEVKVTSISDWIEAVKKSPAFQKSEDKYRPDPKREQPEFRLGEYRMSDLTIPNLTLPEITPPIAGQIGKVDSEFDINLFSSSIDESFDIRTEGANLLEKWGPVMYPPSETSGGPAELTPTPAEFKAYIEQNMKPDPNNPDLDFALAVNYLIMVENKLRNGSNKIDSLTNEAEYPLFVWALMMNLPQNAQPAPSLVSKKQVEQEMDAYKLTEGRFGLQQYQLAPLMQPQQQLMQPQQQPMQPTQEPASQVGSVI